MGLALQQAVALSVRFRVCLGSCSSPPLCNVVQARGQAWDWAEAASHLSLMDPSAAVRCFITGNGLLLDCSVEHADRSCMGHGGAAAAHFPPEEGSTASFSNASLLSALKCQLVERRGGKRFGSVSTSLSYS